MNKNIFPKSRMATLSLLVAMVAIVVSCNKALPTATPIIYPPVNNSTITIGAAISSDTTLSFFKAAATRVGMLATLSDTNSVFTVFLPDNNAFRLSGITSTAVINGLPIATVAAIIQYHVIPGQQYLSAGVSTSFPNIQLPSNLKIGTLPGTPINLNMSAFPSVRTSGFWDNNIPVISADNKYQNGVVHKVAAIVNPPSRTLKDSLYRDPQLSYFKAAVARADSGQTGLNKIDSLLGYAVTNMTVLAPNNAAFQTLIFGLAFQGYLDFVSQYGPPTATDTANAIATANGAVAAGPIFLSTNNVTSAEIQGILAYHLLATPNPNTGAFEPNIRAFSVNFSSTPSFHTTLVNAFYAMHPGIMAQATFAGPFATGLTFTGLGTFPSGGAPFSGGAANVVISSNGIGLDNHCINGNYFVIDKVLLPQ